MSKEDDVRLILLEFVDVDDAASSFVEAGGDSFGAVTASERILSEVGLEVLPEDILSGKSIRDIARDVLDDRT